MMRTGLYALAATCVFLPATTLATPTETLLHTFHGTSDGGSPTGNLVRTADGTLYGVTMAGGSSGLGTVFRLAPPATPGGAWRLTKLHTFAGGTDGATPLGGLVKNAAGELFGTASAGGSGGGIVYRLTPPAPGKTGWTYKVLHRFVDGTLGSAPYAPPAIGPNGVLYGSTSQGGTIGGGVVWSLTPPAPGKTAWTYAVLLNLSDAKEGRYPGEMIRATNGRLYGMTSQNGPKSHGTVFVVRPPSAGQTKWTSAVLHAFDGNDGATATGTLAMTSAGTLYGTTERGGTGDHGTVFRMVPPAAGHSTWTFSTLYAFTSGADGSCPYSGVVTTTAGGLIGTTDDLDGGYGTVFRLDPPAPGKTKWTKTLLHRFVGPPDGVLPYTPPIVTGDGTLFGATGYGGSEGWGVVYRLKP